MSASETSIFTLLIIVDGLNIGHVFGQLNTHCFALMCIFLGCIVDVHAPHSCVVHSISSAVNEY